MNKPKPKTIFLVAFFKFDGRGPEYGTKRLHLDSIWNTEEEARKFSFCDEAGWYEGVLIEERTFGYKDMFFRGKRVWLLMDETGKLNEIIQPSWFDNVLNLIG